jgi:hypothetical protein
MIYFFDGNGSVVQRWRNGWGMDWRLHDYALSLSTLE